MYKPSYENEFGFDNALDRTYLGLNRYTPTNPANRNYNSDTFATDTFADLQRAEYADYKARFRPQEKKLMSLAEGEELLDAQLSRISQSSTNRFKQSAINTQMQDQRYGVQRTGRVKNATDTQRGLQKGLAISQSKNMSRLAADERQMGILSGNSNTRQLANQQTG